MDNFFNFVVSQKSQILDLLMQHISLTLTAILIAILVGVPLGIIVSRVKFLRKPIIGFVNLIQAVPSMALLGLLIPLLGIGSTPAIFMVVIYSLLPIVKNTYTGLTSIDPVILESAKGIGLTRNQTLFRIQLPLALPIIMAGVRISAVTAVGLMTLAAFIGAGGLGYLVFSGVQTVNNSMILAGAIPACILALIVDFIFSKIEAAVTPKGLNPTAPRKNLIALKVIGVIAAILVLFTTFSSLFSNEKDTITIGSKNFTEQLILGNMYADLVEAKTDLNVQRKLNLGGTSVAFGAVQSGDLDMYADYTGTLLLSVMKEQPIKDKEKSFEHIKDVMNTKYGLTLLDPIGFNNTYTLAMMPDVAKKYNINTLSDLAKHSKDFTLSPTIEFENREDGLVGLSKTYNMNFKNVKAMDGSLRYSALSNNESQVVDAFSTDGLLKKFNLKVLEDDKGFFSPYNAVPLVNNKTLENHPELKDVLNSLAGKIDEKTMIDLNYQVDELGKSPEEVAHQFLVDNSLI
ncbi:binding--dependent transport system inner membrane component family protein [Clostridium baratii str. Sullivan]|uniref:Binding--dependent transport system inner membrane component family protein n=1 Tax=Clostridium baratii str. Sullivan TaxID=1415775 RepID=A0A0A7FX03_9CLOT|nr:glycine betaine ABC transporter substrate-binding protein [Clostridium baratii]AIY83465.1 binding--dependent transport system inner membrane component family protein [Clostridium baratii str. Sullivan]